MALYVYGLMRARDAAAAVDANNTGTRSLAAVEHRGLGALVSPMPESEIRLRRDEVLSHADVLQAAFEHGPVLPLRFGSVVEDERAVIDELIGSSAEQLAARLNALENAVEMQVKAVYAEEPLLRSILARDPTLARTVKRMQQLPAAATHFERIRIGEAIAAAVQTRRAVDEHELLSALSPLAIAVSVSEPHHERAAVNAAFLLDRSSLAAFDAAVERLSEARAVDTQFKLIGPLPPYSFADRDWGGGRSEEAMHAWA